MKYIKYISDTKSTNQNIYNEVINKIISKENKNIKFKISKAKDNNLILEKITEEPNLKIEMIKRKKSNEKNWS